MGEGVGPLTTRARDILHEWVQAESLRKHCEAVAACLGHFARQQGADEDVWVAVGLLHDMDFERHPNLELSESGHPFVGVRYLRQQGWSDEITRAILSHADYSGVEPISPMEKTLVAVDELSGFVTASALVRPDKRVAEVKVASVRKKMKDKSFAAKVSRADIERGAVLLELPLDSLIQEVVVALATEADRLGLAGTNAEEERHA
ncbi:MAG: HDIG domain-containing protein [Chloroflexia bacterium]|nr:HDIG domain-containing protein [Chloroflexia bacterium]MDQ3412571.1 HDIG domain-containing protein [Chloroflexota bacterium]